jgi:hypothetical protein
MASITRPFARLDDLHDVEGKAELIGGRIIHPMPTGDRPGLVAGRSFRSLDPPARSAEGSIPAARRRSDKLRACSAIHRENSARPRPDDSGQSC